MKRTKDKADFIFDYYLAHREEDDIYLTLHALFNCISEQEITELYFDQARAEPVFKKSLESYIVKRTTTQPLRRFDKIAKKLLADYPHEPYEMQLQLRVFLMSFMRSLSPEIIRTFYDLLITSDRVIDRRRAGEVADLIWCDEVEGNLWDNFHKYKDEESLIPLVKNLSDAGLCDLMEKCWTVGFPSYRLKNAVVPRLAKLPADRLHFLKKVEPAYYVRAMVLQGKKVSTTVINQLIKTIPAGESKFLVWYIGLTGDWDLLIKHISR